MRHRLLRGMASLSGVHSTESTAVLGRITGPQVQPDHLVPNLFQFYRACQTWSRGTSFVAEVDRTERGDADNAGELGVERAMLGNGDLLGV